jgi:hypothetical protein
MDRGRVKDDLLNVSLSEGQSGLGLNIASPLLWHTKQHGTVRYLY